MFSSTAATGYPVRTRQAQPGEKFMAKFVTPENNKKAVFPVFPVPIYINRLTDDREFNQELVQKVETLRNSDPEGVEICEKEYRNGYTSFFSLNQIQKDAEFSELAEQILRHGRFVAQTMGFSTENPPLNLTTMFGTITGKGCHHELHRHRNSLISGTYYVSANKTSSRISFLDPKAGFRMHEPGGQTGQTIFSNLEFSVQPQSGLIVMFPSFLEHRVEMQQNDIPRVGITFNLDLIRDEDC
jgi:uncharacterized protein (TIGR02466 family)